MRARDNRLARAFVSKSRSPTATDSRCITSQCQGVVCSVHSDLALLRSTHERTQMEAPT